MKRSDMVLKLMESMVEAPEDLEEAADYLLAHLEKNGMRPPHTKVINCNCYDHEWEEENA